jgi:signal transduction histidine kinase
MQLEVDIGDELLNTCVTANASSVEQILVNLVDNACKYAGSATDKRIHLRAERRDGRLQLRVRDHGPGLSAEQANHLFQAFSKSAVDAAHTAPGVGLGLALSRRLARTMQGDLFLDQGSADGACFVLVMQCSAETA